MAVTIYSFLYCRSIHRSGVVLSAAITRGNNNVLVRSLAIGFVCACVCACMCVCILHRCVCLSVGRIDLSNMAETSGKASVGPIAYYCSLSEAPSIVSIDVLFFASNTNLMCRIVSDSRMEILYGLVMEKSGEIIGK